MGKYMKNSKLKSSSTQIPNNATTTTSSIGVRTRAKTLALQSLHTTDAAPANSSSYLQLRSRRLKKPPPPRQKKLNQTAADDADRNGEKFCGHRVSSRLRRSSSDSESRCFSRCVFDEISCGKVAGEDVEASFGENFLDFEQLKRTTRESTPCSAVRDFNIIETPGSATRSSKRSPNPIQIPLSEINSTTQEMDDFFSSIERQEQQLFMDKYNFDFANDKPLPGGFEWEQVRA
ncbi:unnamed protein product [Rhodiola kirilowii]